MQRTNGPDGKTEHINYPGLGKSFGYGFPPPYNDMQGPMNSVVQSVVQAVAKLDDATTAAGRDATLSDPGRRAKVASAQTAAQHALTQAQQRLKAEGARIDAAIKDAYAIPTLDPTDAVGAALDTEIRARVIALDGVPRDRMVTDIKTGKQDRVLQALGRDPFDSFWSEFARGLLAEQAERDKPEEMAAIERSSALLEWAVAAVRGLANVLAAAGVRQAA